MSELNRVDTALLEVVASSLFGLAYPSDRRRSIPKGNVTIEKHL